ncbi:MAG: patatin-like phospholipase family protein [Candidatus Yanofskybacteria bacterium]|nr:patatin-like phospholipase family protein [Candidatus Yanofskybacteria bacterium]
MPTYESHSNDANYELKNIVIYLGGGNMSGVFGAGIVTAFQEQNIYPKINSIYGTSAGILNGAYFLSKQTRLGSSVYWENLNKNFVSRKNFWIGVWQRFQNKFVKPVPEHKLKDVLDIDYLMDLVRNKKRLNSNLVISQDTPIYAKLLDIDGHRIDYVDIRRPDIFKILKAAVNPLPYTHTINKINGKRYVDAGIVDRVGVETLLSRHPDSKIFVILNQANPLNIGWRIKSVLDGKFLEWMLGDSNFYSLCADIQNKFQKDLEIIKTHPNIVLVMPSKKIAIASRITSSKKLINLYNAGILEGNRIIQEHNL